MEDYRGDFGVRYVLPFCILLLYEEEARYVKCAWNFFAREICLAVYRRPFVCGCMYGVTQMSEIERSL